MLRAYSARRSAVRGLSALVLASLFVAPAAVAQPGWPNEVKVRYKLEFNGFDVGAYEFISRYDGQAYRAQSSAKVSALFGAFKWNGNLQGSGAIASHGPQPKSYQLSYNTKKKSYSVQMGFAGQTVKTVNMVPNKPPSPEAVKVKSSDLQNVFDPISASLAISAASEDDACNRTIPIFDGKSRFDLRFSPKGYQKVKEKQSGVEPSKLIVCQIKYVPISGHKPKDFEKPWVDYDKIEIALRPIPRAGIYVPYSISVPTTIGSATMTAEQINIVDADNSQIALKY